MSVVVVGSFVTDCIATCKKAPLAGETVTGLSFNTYLGGKGANQAFAAKRMGSETYMIGALGKDGFGEQFIECMAKEGFDTSYVEVRTDAPTGTSLVTVEEGGQNRIVMTPGANLSYASETLEKHVDLIKNASYVVTQYEMTPEIVLKLIEICKRVGTNLIINPAPARVVDKKNLDGVYLMTPNETELGIIIGKEITNLDEYKAGARELLSYGVKNVIVTLGTQGSLLVNNEKEVIVPAYKVKAIDTVGAGDSFTGSLSACLDQGMEIEEAMKIATAVAALEVQHAGAIPAMPYKEKVLEFIEQHK